MFVQIFLIRQVVKLEVKKNQTNYNLVLTPDFVTKSYVIWSMEIVGYLHTSAETYAKRYAYWCSTSLDCPRVNPVSELRAWRQEEAKEAYLINLWNMHMCGVIVPHEGFMELFGVTQGWCYHGGRPIKIKG